MHPHDRKRVEDHLDAVEAAGERRWSEEYRFRHEDGSYRWFWDRGVITRGADGKPVRFIGCMTDISAQRVAEERIWQLANQDELTGLPNRKVFHGQLKGLQEAPEGDSRSAAMLLIDIDHFKDVNDSLGHPAGDALLKAVSSRLKSSVGNKGTVFRLGGDEFSILLPGFDRQASLDMAPIALGALAEPIVVADQMVTTRATIGIVHLPRPRQRSGDAAAERRPGALRRQEPRPQPGGLLRAQPARGARDGGCRCSPRCGSAR